MGATTTQRHRPGLRRARFEPYWQLAQEAVRSSPPYLAERHRGRGIVTCAGGTRYFPSAWVLLNMLRHLGCRLPVEVWYLGRREMSDGMIRLLEPLGATCVDACEMRRNHPARRLHGWALKPYSMIHCRYEEVLFLDADNMPVVNPEFLFEEPAYRAAGAAFWPDLERFPRHHPAWRLCQVEYRDEPQVESGQMLVDKRRCWQALRLAMHYNECSEEYYRHMYGDKDTFHMAWRRLGLDYAMPPHPLQWLYRVTMCQHDFAGRVIFQHRNMAKWLLPVGSNRRIPGFQHEDLCLRFLEELAAKWSGRVDDLRVDARS